MSDDPIPLQDDRSEAERWIAGLGYYSEVEVQASGKRCGVQWTSWMDDWFTSWSPRNSNNHAEGPWDHWVDLAIQILRDPMTKITRPSAHEVAMRALPDPVGFYDQHGRDLTPDELMARFRGEVS